MAKKCPACGSPASGKFCSHCGASLGKPLDCTNCGNPLPVGARFCNMCGTPVAVVRPSVSAAAGSGIGGGGIPRWAGVAATVALVVVVFLVAFPSLRPGSSAAGPTAAPSAGGPGAIDLSAMTPEEAAGRLFNRVMEYVSAGDSVQARAFAPMAIAAYERVPAPTLDDLYHVAVLNIVNNDAVGARTAADRILTQVPTHLFGLYTAAQAEQLSGDLDTAIPLYRQFLANYDAEVAGGRVEYNEHSQVLPAMKREAERLTAGP